MTTVKSTKLIIVKSAQFIGALIMSEDRDQSSSLIESDNDSEPAVQHQMNPRVEAKINALCAQTGLIMKQVRLPKFIWGPRTALGPEVI